PTDVGRDTGPVRGKPILLAGAGSAGRGFPRRVLIAAAGGIEGVEAVAETAGRLVRHEGVLAPPARPVGRSGQHVEIHEAAVAAGRRAIAGGVEPVDGN